MRSSIQIKRLARWPFIAAGLAALLLIAAACGGGQGEEAGKTTPSATGTPAAQETPTATETAAAETPGAGDLAQELESLAKEWANKPAKVSYEFTSTSDGEEESGTMTVYWRPPDAWRFDYSDEAGGGSVIVSGGTTYFCDQQEEQCLSMNTPISQVVPLPFVGFFADPTALSDYILEVVTGLEINRSSRTIAGEDARCYSTAGTIEGQTGQAEWCFTSDGILLLLSGSSSGPTGEGSFHLEATSVSRQVSDADLEPPYPVMELPSFDFTPGP